MEYLMTYGWAILVLMIVIAALYSLGVFNTNATTANICTLPANVGCVSAILWPNGVVQVNIQQATQYTINIIGVGCHDQNLANAPVISPPVTLPIGGNNTFTAVCSTGGTKWLTYNAAIGATYTGFLIVNYTDISTGFTHTVSGTLIQKVK